MKTTPPRTRRLLNPFAVFVSCLIIAHLAGHTSVVQAQLPIPGLSGKLDISKVGPYFGTAYLLHQITATVLVRKEPGVIEYQLGRESTATLTFTRKIKGKDQTLFALNLETTGDEIKQMKFMLPEELGDKAKEAVLSVMAKNRDPNNKQPPDFALYGLGLGEKAVGSLFIVDLNFQPARFNSKQEKKVNYSFRSRSEFEKAYVKIWYMGKTRDGMPANQDVSNNLINRLIHRGETVVGDWDGKNKQGKVSTGRHQLFVSAWYSANQGGDWTCAWSQRRLLVE